MRSHICGDQGGLGQFGWNWNEFDLFNIPVTTSTYNPPQPIFTPITSINNQYGYAVSATIYIPGGWSNTVIGNGFDLFGSGGLAFAAFFRSPQVIAAANKAKNFMKLLPEEPVPTGSFFSDNAPLDWERDFMSDELKAMKAAMDGFADWLDGTMESVPIFVIDPCVMQPGLMCGPYAPQQL